jgi:surface polysaccharide O-acyltransferase-like enzyme
MHLRHARRRGCFVVPPRNDNGFTIFTMSSTKPQNIDWINNLRLVALYAVIILHCTSLLLMQYGKVSMSDWMVADFFNAIVRFAVPVFVMVTGALLLHREYEIGDFLKKRLVRVVVPFIFWSLVYIGYALYNEDITFTSDVWANTKQVLHQLKTGSSYHLWYVYMLIGLYFFIPIIGKFVRHASEKEILYFLAVWFAVMLITQPYLSRFNPSVDMHYFAGFAGYLVLGHYLAFKDFNLKHLRLWMVLLFIANVLLIAIGSRLIVDSKQWPGTMFFEPVSPLVVLLAASVFMIFKLSAPKLSPIVKRIRDFAGGFNYGIYLAHALVLYLLEDPTGISYKLCTPAVAIPLTALICFIVSLGLVWVVNKVPVVGKWISG